MYAVRMHGEAETSRIPRVAWVLVHLVLVGVGVWMLVGGGLGALGRQVGSDWGSLDRARAWVLAGFGVMLWVRMTLTALVLLQRRFPWSEFFPVSLACAVYQIGFPLLAGAGPWSDAGLGWPDAIGIGLFIGGSALNTGSELQRKRFKTDPASKGKLYTRGLFSVVRHPNYLGDTLWCAGWAVVTHNPWSAVVPLALAAGFIFFFIPALSRHLREHYGSQYDAWAEETKAFVPWVW